MEMKSTNYVNISGYYDLSTRQYHFWFDYEEVIFNEEDFKEFVNLIGEAKFWGNPVS